MKSSIKNKNRFVVMYAVITCVLALFCSACSGESVQTNTVGDPEINAVSTPEIQDINVDSVVDGVVDSVDDESGSDDEPAYTTLAFSKESTIIYTADFETDGGGFLPHGAADVGVTADIAYSGVQSMSITNRNATWSGAEIILDDWPRDGKWIQVEAWVRHEGAEGSVRVNCTLQIDGSSYITCGSVVSNEGEWTKLEGCAIIPEDASEVVLYFETNYRSAPEAIDLADLYVDDIVVSEVVTEGSSVDLPPLFETYINNFSIGCGVTAYDLRIPERADIVNRHFNSITMGNEMKPDYILDYDTSVSDYEKYNLKPAIHTRNLDIGLDFAVEHGLKVRMHTLVWHSQTPIWFFKEGYSREPDAPYVSREVMLARMESYIEQVVTYCQQNYPGIIYCYDVVNEAIQTSDGEPDGIRTEKNPWYDTVGADYVEKAFIFARKYVDEGIQLFYNDYNCTNRTKLFAILALTSDLHKKGLIDGIGMQGHVGMTEPTITDFQYAIEKIGETGMSIQITELDISQTDNSPEGLAKLASRYKRLMAMFRFVDEHGQADITNITVWGLTDDHSWLSDATGTKYPLLFDAFLQPKQAFYGFAMDASVPLTP